MGIGIGSTELTVIQISLRIHMFTRNEFQANPHPYPDWMFTYFT
jgi:hypothetical protein